MPAKRKRKTKRKSSTRRKTTKRKTTKRKKRKTTKRKKTKKKRSTAMAAKSTKVAKRRKSKKPALLAGFPKLNKTTGMQILKTGAAVVIGRVIVSRGMPDVPYLSEESVPWIIAALIAGSATEKRIYWTIALTLSALEIAEERGWLDRIGLEAA